MTKPFMSLLCSHPPASTLSLLPHPSLTVSPLSSLLFMLPLVSVFSLSLALSPVSHSQFESLYSPLCLSLPCSRSRLCYFFFLSHLVFITPSAPLLSPSYIIFSLNTSPPPSSSPFYLSLSRDLNSAHHLSYSPLPNLLCPPQACSPSFTYMLSYSLPMFLIAPTLSPLLFLSMFLSQLSPTYAFTIRLFHFLFIIFPLFFSPFILTTFSLLLFCHLFSPFLRSLPMYLPFQSFLLSLGKP